MPIYQLTDPSNPHSNLIRLNVIINNEPFNAVLDTGSSLSIIKRKLVTDLNLSTRPQPHPFTIRQLNGAVSVIVEATPLDFHIKDRSSSSHYEHLIYIIEEMIPDILLGLDFCKKHISYIIFTDDKQIDLIPKKNVINSQSTQLIEVNAQDYINILACDYKAHQTKESQFENLVNLFAAIPEERTRLNSLNVQDPNEIFAIEQMAETTIDYNFDDVIGTDELEERRRLRDLFNEYRFLFATTMSELTQAKGVEHTIELTTETPVKRAPYRVSAKERSIIQEQITEMLSTGIIRPSHSSYSSPIVLVRKKDNTSRFCIDFRELNAITVKDRFPLPVIPDLIHSLQGCKYLSTLDMFSGYFQIAVAEKDRHKTAFISTAGLYEFNRLPFGLTNAPAVYQRMINDVFKEYLYSSMMTYLDDVIIFSRTFDEHIKHLENAFNKIDEYNLRMKPSKCTFLAKETYFLGFVISEHGIAADPKKLNVVKNFPQPKTQRDVRSFLGLTGYYRSLIKNYGKIAKPLTDLLKKDCNKKIIWTDEIDASFQELKNRLIKSPILAHYIPDEKLILYTDASNFAAGWILCQIQDGKERVLEYGSKVFNPTQQKYCVSDKEMLAIVTACTKLRHFLAGESFIIRTDHHALCFLMRVRDPSGRLMRYGLRLQEFDFKIEHKSGKSHMHVDALSRYPESDNTEKYDDVEEIPVFISEIEGLHKIPCKSLNNCILRQEVKPYFIEIPNQTIATLEDLNMRWTESVYITERPRKDISFILTNIEPEPEQFCAEFTLDEYDMSKAQLEDKWCQSIVKALERNNPKALKRFELKNGTLYKKTFDDYGNSKTLLCLPRELRQPVLQELHASLVGGGHGGYFKTSAKLRDRFYYPKRDQSVRKFILSCDCCQFRKSDTTPKGTLTPIRTGKPFDLIGMDLIGPLPRSGVERFSHIICCVDYATRYTITKAISEANKEEIADFLIKDIILEYGAPRRILTDNGTPFTSNTMQSVLDFYRVSHSYAAPYRPNVNGLTERTNRTLIDSISLYCSSNQTNWSSVLKCITFCHNTARSRSLKFSPGFALRGFEPTLILDVNLKIDIDSDIRHMPEYLTDARHLISENLKDAQHLQKEKYDEKHKDIRFNVDDLVAVYRKRRRKGVNEKMMRKWEGPYKVIKTYQKPKDYYQLENINNPEVREQIHVSKLKKWYQRTEEDWDPLENFKMESNPTHLKKRSIFQTTDEDNVASESAEIMGNTNEEPSQQDVTTPPTAVAPHSDESILF